jgi:hypothetical protein
MKSSISYVSLALSGVFGYVAAIPVEARALEVRDIPTELAARALGDRNDPYQVHIDCSGGRAVCELDCYTILCLAAPNPVQYSAGASGTHRDESGASTGIFGLAEQNRINRGVTIPQWVISELGTSAEETVMANTAQGGAGDILGPVQANENTSEYLHFCRNDEL